MPCDLRTLAEIADRLRYSGSDRERSVRRLFQKHKIGIVRRDRGTYLVSETQYATLLEAISCSRLGSAENTSTAAVGSVSGVKRGSSKNILAAQIAETMPTTTKRNSKRTSGMK